MNGSCLLTSFEAAVWHHRDQPQDVREQISWNGDLGHLEGDVAAITAATACYINRIRRSMVMSLRDA
jgi:hypothetical protein